MNVKNFEIIKIFQDLQNILLCKKNEENIFLLLQNIFIPLNEVKKYWKQQKEIIFNLKDDLQKV